MTDKLPPNLLALFAPRPPLRFMPPADHPPGERKTAAISGIASFLPALQEYKETDKYIPTESWLQRKDRIRLEKKEKQEKLLKEGPLSCEGDPTCFDYLLLSLSELMDSCSLTSNTDMILLQTNRKRIQILEAMLTRPYLLQD
jgi:U1 small nuclear ribonucleoprotein